MTPKNVRCCHRRRAARCAVSAVGGTQRTRVALLPSSNDSGAHHAWGAHAIRTGLSPRPQVGCNLR
eukprot:scaffold132468_cov75-Phaeocystis_antarctica.AAC.4